MCKGSSRTPPNFIKKFIPQDHALGVLRQELQCLEFLSGNYDLLTGSSALGLCEVDDYVFKDIYVFRHYARRAPDLRAHARNQLTRVEGCVHVILRTHLRASIPSAPNHAARIFCTSLAYPGEIRQIARLLVDLGCHKHRPPIEGFETVQGDGLDLRHCRSPSWRRETQTDLAGSSSGLGVHLFAVRTQILQIFEVDT